MSRIEQVAVEEAKPELKDVYQNVKKKIGAVPNFMQYLGNSPAALKGFLGLLQAVEQTTLNPKLREQIALAVSEANHCNYCLAIHTHLAKMAGLPDQEIILARKSEAQDPKTKAILKFVRHVVDKRAIVSNEEIESLKATGITDSELVEIILNINLSMFTNYFNLIVDPKSEWPLAPKLS